MSNQEKTLPYIVLFERDLTTEKSERAQGREIYDGLQSFRDPDSAYEFFHDDLAGKMIAQRVGYKLPEQTPHPKNLSEYLVIAHFPEKYWYHDYGGGKDPVPTHEVARVSESLLEQTVEAMAKEGGIRIIVAQQLPMFWEGVAAKEVYASNH
ncbi:hypothetical protein HZB02_04940 [Candidatus Woesearchaeota archaeon]|nr:hypothetical protein [Candidatus Woesearchaeota archaeon]